MIRISRTLSAWLRPRPLLGAVSLLAASPAALALSLDLSGFATVTAGSVLEGSRDDKMLDFQCPCFIANYEYAGMYEDNGWTMDVETTFGAQADIHVDDALTATLQLTGRGLEGFEANFDWAYLTYRIGNNWTLQAGHKRLPLYAYSDSNYIGYSYPWVRPPVDVYGWEIYSYNGVNAAYANTLGDWALRTNVWAGSQSDKDSAMLSNLYYGERVGATWDNILGGAVEAGNDIVSMRLVYMQSDLQYTVYPANGDPAFEDLPADAGQQIYGASFNVDYRNFLWRSEYNTFIRSEIHQNAPSFLLSTGYRIGDFTVLYTYSQYREESDADYPEPQRYHTQAGTVRWDFRRKMALKAQVDRFKDQSTVPFVGDATLATLSLTTVF